MILSNYCDLIYKEEIYLRFDYTKKAKWNKWFEKIRIINNCKQNRKDKSNSIHNKQRSKQDML